MAKDATFDIVSEVNMAEVTNAVNQAEKEISQRYDFKGVNTEIVLENNGLKITTGDDMHLKSVVDILQSKFIKRQVPIDNLEYGKVEAAAGGSVRQMVTIKQGIEKDLAAFEFQVQPRLARIKEQLETLQSHLEAKE